jgi:small-conductance mechanosensitive channel
MTASDRLNRLLAGMAEIFDVASMEAMALRVLGAALILLATFWIARALRRFLARRVQAHDLEDEKTIRLYGRFFLVVIAIVGVSLAVHTLGIDLTHVFTAGGLLAVAAAFAMKNLAENLIGGLLLRLEKLIKPGDVLLISGEGIVKVKKIGARTTIVRSKSENDLILPNVELIQNPISNYTYGDTLHRIDTTVGVAYTSDLRKVCATLEEACGALDWKSSQRPPRVQLTEFGDSSVNFRVLVWAEDPWAANHFRSELNEAIWWALKEAGIVIAFPQLDVHIVKGSPSAVDR